MDCLLTGFPSHRILTTINHFTLQGLISVSMVITTNICSLLYIILRLTAIMILVSKPFDSYSNTTGILINGVQHKMVGRVTTLPQDCLVSQSQSTVIVQPVDSSQITCEGCTQKNFKKRIFFVCVAI